MKTLILHNIISSNSVYRLASLIKQKEKNWGEVRVLFCAQTEENRRWNLREKITFVYKVMPGWAVKLRGKDLFTYFVNPSITKELSEFNPDRLVISGWDLFAYQIAYWWGWRHKKEIIIYSDSTSGEKSWRRTVSRPLVRVFVKVASGYIAAGTRARAYLMSLGAKEERVEIFQLDVNKGYFMKEAAKYKGQREQTKKSLGIKSKYNLLFVGQLIERKGIMDLLKAYKKIAANPSWGLVIVGYGQLEEEISTFISDNQLERVTLLGTVEQYDLPKIYTATDCLVLPSLQEAWGLVVNEALYCGLSVIVSDMCGCGPDLVKTGENGYIYQTGNEVSLLEAINKIIKRYDEK